MGKPDRQLQTHLGKRKITDRTIIAALWSCAIGLLFYCRAEAVEPSDTTLILNEVEVRGSSKPITRSDGSLTLRPDLLVGHSSSAGEVDFIALLKNMPGITSAGDYGSGLQIDGQDASQTMYTINGATVFFPYRFGGIFSTFNTWHFCKADFERNIHGADMHQRTGASLNLSTYTVPDTVRTTGGRASVGLLSSSAAVRMTPSKKLIISAGVRISYIDQIYRHLLRGNTSEIKYGFSDYNLSLSYTPDSRNTIDASLFVSRDRIDDTDTNYALNLSMKWTNLASSLRWIRQSSRMTSIYIVNISDFSNRLNLDMSTVWLKVPSFIRTAGASAEYDTGGWKAGVRFATFSIRPQYSAFDGFGQASEGIIVTRHPYQAETFAQYQWKYGNFWRFHAGINLNGWINGGYRRLSPDPRLTAVYNGNQVGIFTLHAGVYHQNLHNTGLSDIGLASNFWTGASSSCPSQRALSFALNYKRHGYSSVPTVTAEIYYKVVSNQPEYSGIMVDLIDSNYDPLTKIGMTRGYNAGINLGLQAQINVAEVNLAYSFGTARRREPGGKYFPAYTDPGHSLRVNASVESGSKWQFSADFILASGRRHTPVKSLYMIGGNVISEFGPRNSARLPLYHRLDLSATYTIKNRNLSHAINFTLLNAYGHRNVEMQHFSISDDGRYKLKSTASLYRFMPSINYILSF